MEIITALNTGINLTNTALSAVSQEDLSNPTLELHYDKLLIGNSVELPINQNESVELIIENVYQHQQTSSAFAHFRVSVDERNMNTHVVNREIGFIEEGLTGEPTFVNQYEFYNIGPYLWGIIAEIEANTVGPIKFAQQHLTTILSWVFCDFQAELRTCHEAIEPESDWKLQDYIRAVVNDLDLETVPLVLGDDIELTIGYVGAYISYHEGFQLPEYLPFDSEDIESMKK